MRALALLLVFMLIPSFPISTAQTSPTPGQYTIALSNDHVSVALNTLLTQNITTMPPVSFTLTGQNSSPVAAALSNFIRQTVPTATVADLNLKYSSNGTLVSLGLSFTLLGVASADRWGAARANAAWRSLQVLDDLQAGGAAVNLVGKHYLAEGLLSLADEAFHPRPTVRISFKVNGRTTSPLRVKQVAPTLNLLDFSSLGTPLDSWQTQFSISGIDTTWNRDTGFDIAATTIISEPGGAPNVLSEAATYKVNAMIEAPGLAQTQGDDIFYGSSLLEPLFTGLIVLVTVLAMGSYMADRRLTSRRRQKTKRR